MTRSTTLLLPDLAATETVGRRLGQLLFPGAVLSLNGPLGAGKTHLVRAIAEGLEVVEPLQVTSPTFVLIQEYAARLPIYHFDSYRLKSPQDFLDLGAEEYLYGSGVCLIEWADRVAEVLPAEHLRLEFSIEGEHSRRLTLQPHGKAYEAIVSGDLLGS